MARYLVKRSLILIVTLILVSVITFIVFTVIPGDVGRSVLGIDASQKAVDDYNAKLGLDKPVLQRYFGWIGNVLKGDFGESYRFSGQPVMGLIGNKLPVTLMLTIISLFLILLFSIPLAILSAKRERSVFDNTVMIKGQVFMAVPNFFLGLILSWIFGILLNWFIPGAYVDYKTNFGGFAYYMIFPAIALSLPKIGMAVKFLRTSIIEQKKAGYVRTAKGIGLSDREIMYKHILKNALLPFVTFIGVLIAEIIAGSVVIEQVFQLPGLGRLLLEAINRRDVPLSQGLILYIAFIVIFINFIVDVIYKMLDPRVKV